MSGFWNPPDPADYAPAEPDDAPASAPEPEPDDDDAPWAWAQDACTGEYAPTSGYDYLARW